MTAHDAITSILSQVLSEYGPRLSIHGESSVLVSSPSIAHSLYTTTASVRTPYGPRITVADPDTSSSSSSTPPAPVDDLPNAAIVPAAALPMDTYTHAIFGIAGEDPKYILAGLKRTVYALRPKGYAVVISVKQASGRTGEDGREGEEKGGGFQVGLEEKLLYQSKGRVKSLSDVLEFAGFERGRVRSLGTMRSAEGEEGREAEVLLAMKWDQITA